MGRERKGGKWGGREMGREGEGEGASAWATPADASLPSTRPTTVHQQAHNIRSLHFVASLRLGSMITATQKSQAASRQRRQSISVNGCSVQGRRLPTATATTVQEQPVQQYKTTRHHGDPMTRMIRTRDRRRPPGHTLRYKRDSPGSRTPGRPGAPGA
jgi:hypothetical protein